MIAVFDTLRRLSPPPQARLLAQSAVVSRCENR
jgi:hypothetical protein